MFGGLLRSQPLERQPNKRDLLQGFCIKDRHDDRLWAGIDERRFACEPIDGVTRRSQYSTSKSWATALTVNLCPGR